MTRADRVGQGMDPAEALLEGDGGAGRGDQHAFARFQIVAVVDRAFQIGMHQPDAFRGDAGGKLGNSGGLALRRCNRTDWSKSVPNKVAGLIGPWQGGAAEECGS